MVSEDDESITQLVTQCPDAGIALGSRQLEVVARDSLLLQRRDSVASKRRVRTHALFGNTTADSSWELANQTDGLLPNSSCCRSSTGTALTIDDNSCCARGLLRAPPEDPGNLRASVPAHPVAQCA